MGPIVFSLALVLTLVFLAGKNIAPLQRTPIRAALQSALPSSAPPVKETPRVAHANRHVGLQVIASPLSFPSLKSPPKSTLQSTPRPNESTPGSREPTRKQPTVTPSARAAQKTPAPSDTAPLPPAGSEGLPPGVTYASSTDPVRIESISLSSDAVRVGELASAKVVTTSNAASVTARIGTYVVSVPRTAPGIFALSVTVPRVLIPGQTVDVVVTAIRADGASVQRSVPIHVLL